MGDTFLRYIPHGTGIFRRVGIILGKVVRLIGIIV